MKRIAIVAALIISGATLLRAQTWIEECALLFNGVRMENLKGLVINNAIRYGYYAYLTIGITNVGFILAASIFPNSIGE